MSQKQTADPAEIERFGLDPGPEVLNPGSGFDRSAEPPDCHESNDHFVLVYGSREEQFAAVVPFVRHGLERGERCMYIADENSEADIVEAMREGGIDVDAALQSGALTIHSAEAIYRRSGVFDPDDMLALLREQIDEAQREYDGFRVTGEMTWISKDEPISEDEQIAEDDPRIEELVEYEARLNELLSGENCLTLCQYNREAFAPEVIRSLVQTHPHLVYDSTVCQNFYYVPPEEFFGSDRSASEVDRMLETLLDRAAAKTALTARERFLRTLNEITADPDRSFEEKLTALLELGCAQFDLEFGAVARIDVEDDRFEVEHMFGTYEGFRSGLELPLSETYCSLTADHGSTASVRTPEASGRDDVFVNRELGIQTYLGTYVPVENGVDRTLFFASSEPHVRPFSEGEHAFVRLLGQWVEYELGRRQYECQLEQQRAYTNDILDAIDDVFYVLDEDGSSLRWNAAVRNVTGYPDADLASMNSLGLFEKDDRRAVANAIEEGFQSGHARVEATMVTRDRERIPYEFVASTLEAPDGETVLAGIGRDVSERVERERRLETLISNLPGMVYRCLNRPDWPMEYVAGEVEQLTGYTAQQLRAGDVSWGEDILHPEYREVAWSTVQDALECDESFELIYPVVTGDDATKWMWERGRGIYTPDGELDALEGFITDVTDRIEREHELELFRNLIDRSNDGVFVVDPDTGRLRDVNETACHRLGYDREELLDRSVSDVVEGSSDTDARTYFERVKAEGPMLVEGHHQRKDGTTYPVEVNIGHVELDNEYLVGIARNISERVERERYQRELYDVTARKDLTFDEKLRELLELGRERFDLEIGALGQMSNDIYEVVAAVDSEGEVTKGLTLPRSETYCRKTVMSDTPLGITDAPQEGWEDDPAYAVYGVASYVGKTVTVGSKTYGTLCFASRTPRKVPFTDGEYTFLELMSQWVSYELERDHREAQLAALTELSQELMSAETHQEIATHVIEHAESTLGLPLTALVSYDDRTGELTPAAETRRASEALPTATLSERGTGCLWEAFVADERRVVDDVASLSGAGDDLTELVVVPLGPLGVFVTATTADEGFDETELDLVATTAATVEAACIRTERERQLHERERTLEEQNKRLERLDRTNTTIRNIDRALVRASTRGEIEAVVCGQLADAGPYELAWIGEYDRVTDEVVPTEWAGDDRGYLDEITITVDDSPTGLGPTGRAIKTRKPQIVDDVLVDRSFEPWRQAALNRGYHASAALPLVYEETLYGVLNVYANRPGVFDELERAVLAELADNVAYALNTVESKRALVTDQVAELEFTIDGTDSEPITYLDEADATLSLEKLVAGPEGRLRGFHTIKGLSPERVVALDSKLPITDVQLLSAREEADGPVCLFEAELVGNRLISMVVEHGGRVRTMTIEGGVATVVVELAAEADVRAFFEMLRTRYPSLELVAQRSRERSRRTEPELYASLTEELTPRQLEVLQTAYFSGYFERPRVRTGSEIAERLDVSQPTFNAHVRAAQRKLYRLLFEDKAGDEIG